MTLAVNRAFVGGEKRAMERESETDQKRSAADEEGRRDEAPAPRAEERGRCDGEALQLFEV
jgi:hypothetical protein